ncbi:MAG: DinB family protein, partial [Chloroflexi bacterium]|nr:DinB family protein [Chloroflexota bacterium]
CELSDEELDRPWAWREHDEGVRFAHLGTYHELRDLAARLAAGRTATGRPITTAQRILGQYHAAYRDLEAVLLGVGEAELERPPAEGEWPLRRVLGHIIGGDRTFFALVYYALEGHRTNDGRPAEIGDEAYEAIAGTDERFKQVMENETLAGVMAYYQALHDRILEAMAGANEEEVEVLSTFWESQPQTIRYRLHRFDAHLRQHTIQVEKTLAALGRPPNEAKRLLRLVYNALAEVESALIGAWDAGRGERPALAALVAQRTDSLQLL